MKISYNWLKEYLSSIPQPHEVADALTGCGLEVESTESWSSVKGGLIGVVIGEVLTCAKHPDSDHLSLTTVNVGKNEPLNIVCGASNVAAGQKVAVATIGTTLYLGEKEITIQKTKIRGQVSEGMICAEDELGLGTSHAGIMVLDPSVSPGILARDYFEVEEDVIFEIGLTPNRSDATSHFGVARDLAAVLNNTQGRKSPDPVTLKYPETLSISENLSGLKIDVVVEDTDACPRYSGLTFTGIKVKESPVWLKNKLNAVGLRPINNIVDITNFILMELGQPLHAFDAEMIKGRKVVVRKFREPLKFVTLDETEREITGQDLMICDEKDPICIAGVFGGIGSGVTEGTTSVFLESACFNPKDIRKTARYHGLQTDASFRFERGADINITLFALKRAAILIRELAGGEASSPLTDIYPHQAEPKKVDLSYSHLNRLIGKEIEQSKVESILQSLGIIIIRKTNEGLNLEIPSYKTDVTREADVIEEVLRIYGYNNIEFSSEIKSSISSSRKPDPEKLKNAVSSYLVSHGFNEVMNNSLTRSAYYENNQMFPLANCVKIMNPLSRDLDVMRQTLLYGGLETLVHNQNRKIHDCRVFEFGNCYLLQSANLSPDPLTKYREENNLALFMTGKAFRENWMPSDRQVEIYDLTGFVAAVLKILGTNVSQFESLTDTTGIFSQGMEYRLNGPAILRIGILSTEVQRKADMRQEVLYAEINWGELFSLVNPVDKSATELPKFPEVRRDLALLLDQSVKYADLEKLAFATEKKLLKEVGLFDVYEGEKIEKGKKSYALYYILQDEHKTLTDNEIDKVMQRIINACREKFNAIIR